MKYCVNRSIEMMLHLDEDEMNYLKNLTQNCLGSNPANEPGRDKEIRSSIFHALKVGLDGQTR